MQNIDGWKKSAIGTRTPRRSQKHIRRPRRCIAAVASIGVMGCFFAGCVGEAIEPRPGTALFAPADLQGVYLGMEKEQVDRLFPMDRTQLADLGLETAVEFYRDSVRIGVAFAYSDGRVSVATIWYDCSLIPHRYDSLRQDFLSFAIGRNGPDFQRASFDIYGASFVPDIGLVWRHPQAQVVVTCAKPAAVAPDTLDHRLYYQLCLFEPSIAPFEIWPNILVPAPEAESGSFLEADSLRLEVIQRRQLH